MKTCYSCKTEKPLDLYYKDKSRPDGVSSRCCACDKEKRRKAYARRGHVERLNNATWKKQNAKAHSAINNKWSKANPGSRSEYHKRRMKEPMYKIKRNLRKRCQEAIKLAGFKKANRSLSYIGADAEFVARYIEDKFEPGMSWENYGEWHIDHIIPISSAKTEHELHELLKYTNLQPLWAIDNMRKNNRMPDDYCANTTPS